MKKILGLLVSVFLLLMASTSVKAISDPLAVPNNKVGIHIFSEKDLPEAAQLVNTNGDWGYVTFVIAEGERDHDRWQKAFDQMRKLHLIPIVRIASKANGDVWEKPTEAEINNWTAFLNSLNWVTQNRYVIISNEPNHASEWGGTIDPSEYATYLKTFYLKLKEASQDFYVLPAALDASANNSASTMEESRFIKNMIKGEPDVLDFIDGWNSHAYPNPDFSGKETDKGKGSVDTFNWEINLLSSLGITKALPIFITETGWSTANISEDAVAARLDYSYRNVWNDKRIVAVTPFILNYPSPPFSQFSWKKSDGTFYKFFKTVADSQKITGLPKQIVKGDIVAAFAQPIIPVGSEYIGAILARNTGQSIWNFNNVSIGSDFIDLPVSTLSFQDIEPTKLGLIVFKAASPENTGIYTRSLFLRDAKNERVTNSFPIEAYLVKLDKVQISSFFDTIRSYFRSILKI
ncbi:MAG TPA: hypothetical protein VKC54_00830 [Patescibacteria group bacterium]|nr:hypothetical protein [Patescibacteria group bacterium]